MEDQTPNHTESPNKTTPEIETDYAKHERNPGPAPTVNEPDNKGAGQTMKWIIPVILIVLVVIWYFFFKDRAM